MSSATGTQVQVFISHSHADREWAVRLQNVLLRRGVVTYLDQDRIQPGDELPRHIQDGIFRSQILLLIWSSKAQHSTWVDREWKFAYELRKRIVPYCLDAAPLPGPLGNLVFVDRADHERAYAGLLKAVLGPSFQPEPNEVFPGPWLIELNAYGMGTAVYDLDLRANGQLSGKGHIPLGGPIEGMVAANLWLPNILNMPFEIVGNWGYETTSEILTLEWVAHGPAPTPSERVDVRIRTDQQHALEGTDLNGRAFRLRRRHPATRAALSAVHELEALQRSAREFSATEWTVEAFPDALERLASQIEITANDPRIKSACEAPDVDWFKLASSLRELAALNVSHGAKMPATRVLAAGLAKLIDIWLERA